MEAPRVAQELDRFDVRLFTLGGTPMTHWDVGFDCINVGGVEGGVVEIGAGATTVLTADNGAAIVPNQNLVTDTVKNWRHSNGAWQLHVAVSA